MSFISYAQNFEDVLLWRALRHIGKGFYIDTAAGDPDASISRALYERGWHGINLAPSRTAQAAMLIARPADINLHLVAGAAAASVTVYDIAGADATLDEDSARRHSAAGAVVVQRAVEQQTLSAICAGHAAPDIHVLRLRTGAELAGLDLARWRPWILVVAHGAGHAGLAAARYELAYDDGQNHFYIAAEHGELRAPLRAGPSAADDFVLRPGHPYAYPLAELHARVDALTAAVTAEKERADAARAWAEARVREREAQAQAREQAAHAGLEQADARALAATQHSAALDQRWAAAETYGRALENALAEANARTGLAEQHTRERVADYDDMIHAIYDSWSWRLTRPLRWANDRVRQLRAVAGAAKAGARRGAARLRCAAAASLKDAVRRMVRAIMSRPALSFFVRSQIGRHPRLTNWLRVTVQRTQAGAPAAAPIELATDPDNMPSSARQVLDDLRRSMKSARHQ
jgi:hypothetical protein